MTGHRTRARRRRWSDGVVIVASMYALAASVWIPPEVVTTGQATEAGYAGWLLAAYRIGGVLGLGAIFAAFWFPGLARGMVAGAGLLMLTVAVLLATQPITILAVISLAVPGIALLAAAPFAGRMPTPEEERTGRLGEESGPPAGRPPGPPEEGPRRAGGGGRN